MDYFDFAPPAESPGMPAGWGTHVKPESGAVPTPSAASARPNFRDWLLIIDESHVTIPQVRAMFNGDRNRKTILVEHGFRLPAALDNRPLRFEEFEAMVPQVMFVSATPAPYELERSGGEVAEQVIRPTGLLDPEITVLPADGQVPDLVRRCKEVVQSGERVLVTALTKRLCEDLTVYLDQQGLRVRYLHSEIDTLERVTILTDLRTGQFDVLVGVNLLREGLDLPEVALVAILDADKEGFLRSGTSLIQQMGRAARNANSKVVLYADKMTPAMQVAIEETERRRKKQLAYNEANGIVPQTIRKAIKTGLQQELAARRAAREAVASSEPDYAIEELLQTVEEEMLDAASEMAFERAAVLRDQSRALKKLMESGGVTRVKRSELELAMSGKLKSRKAGMPGVRAGKRARKGRS
jgi:excinuclease ABC subunit B